MDRHYPNTAWITLQRDVFDQLYEFKRKRGFLNWEQTVESLIETANSQLALREVVAEEASA
jgi:hypothetical protein